MKIAVASDIHLEFGTITLENPGGVDVLILSGDICVAADLREKEDNTIVQWHKSEMIHEFFYTCCNNFPHVVYVAGNHEHYHFDYKYTLSELKRMLRYLPNLQILDKESWTLHEEVTFIGGTLWTDMNNEDPLTLHSIASMMNDFRTVKNSNRYVYRNVPVYEYDENGSVKLDEKGYQMQIGMKKKEEPSRFSPEDAVTDHKMMVEYIKHAYDNTPDDRKVVVVGHHAPSKLSTHPRYANEQLMNGGYSSDLSEFILDRPRIKLWTHGHTHEDFDYMIGNTRIVCNPRGYINYEDRADKFTLKVIEV